MKKSIWEKGFKKGQMDEEHLLTTDIVQWLDGAIDSYYRERIYTVLSQIDHKPTDTLVKAWEDLMEEMYGDFQSPRQELIKVALNDEKVSTDARKWLQQFLN